MRIIRDLEVIPNLALALGYFDGVHLGHREVIKCAVNYAKHINVESAVITFKQRPRDYLTDKNSHTILQLNDKYKEIANLGVNYLIELDFSRLYYLNAQEYLDNILNKYFSPKVISTGFNHHFGANKEGNVNFLSDNQDKYGYQYFATPPMTIYGSTISSSTIKNYISDGNVNGANLMLGYNFYVRGEVVEGKKLGRKLGFPTANIIYPKEIVKPKFGVYEVKIQTPDGVYYKGIANIGVKPTVSDENKCILETHIFNLDGNLYGQNLKVEFIKMLRPEMQFNDLDSLKMQISFDIQSLQ